MKDLQLNKFSNISCIFFNCFIQALDCEWMKKYSDSEKLEFTDAAQTSLQ